MILTSLTVFICFLTQGFQKNRSGGSSPATFKVVTAVSYLLTSVPALRANLITDLSSFLFPELLQLHVYTGRCILSEAGRLAAVRRIVMWKLS